MKLDCYAAFLKGINVGGHKKIRMQDLKVSLNTLGFQHLSTYIQSGNVAFCTADADIPRLKTQIEDKIMTDFGFEVAVILRKATELHQIIENNPFLKEASDDSSNLYITMLEEKPEKQNLVKLLEFSFPQDLYEVIGKEVYLNCLNGYGNTKLSNDFFEKKLRLKATTRNWKTMLKMQEIQRSLE
ncbi:DUF1697 domain-containing protein [Catalinimonas niigatensis]|uniref:DUF1697 domain-containing protein n=1 Tax=Catalinimonas niigatensis TaxID=1397264 RepID=UPI002665B0E2|nr:DUF1697 domain-containing protein [Catalinimonas niigatensis]WPP51254.1 DUF1697 domain-containing protein [Catalinimonas niigatensis]